MENENKNPEVIQNQPVPEGGNVADQPEWFQDVVEQYDVDKHKQGEILKGKILDLQESSILIDVGFKRDAIIPSQDLDRVDPEYREKLSVGDEIYVSVIRTPLGDDDLLVSLSKGLAHKTWLKVEQIAEGDDLLELEVVD